MAASAAPSSCTRLLLASPHSPPTLPRLRRAGGRSLGLSWRGGSARLRVVRRAEEEDESGAASRGQEVEEAPEEPVAGRDLVTLAACLVGLLTGVSVVLFNLSVRQPPRELNSGLMVSSLRQMESVVTSTISISEVNGSKATEHWGLVLYTMLPNSDIQHCFAMLFSHITF